MERVETALQFSRGQRGSFEGLGHEEDGYCFPDVQEKLVQTLHQKGLTSDFEKNYKKQHPFWDEFV
jgi:hypothetical protein